MTEFLLELYSEEIPARMQKTAAEEIAGKIASNAECYYTPQRIVVVADLPDTQPDQVVDKKGPAVGSPEQAVQGFLKSVGLTDISQAQTIEEKGRTFYYYKNTSKGKATAEFLAEALPKILNEYTWPKSMRWGSGETRWVRPLHSIIAIFGGKVIPFKFGEVTSGNTTVGHRFLDKSQFTATSFEQYKTELEKRKVIVDQARRKEIIQSSTRAKAKAINLEVWERDENLLNEVTNLVEWPEILVGEYPSEFLSLPREVLESVMRTHQKYLWLINPSNFELSNKFFITSNMVAEDGGKKIIAGNERVIKARFSDAKFFWEQDQKTKLQDLLPKLELVTFHAKVGNLRQKTNRIAHIAKYIANIIGADAKLAERAALLCKADLVSGMVGEFAELQGIMGCYYANLEGEKPEVANAIKEHYLPQGQDDLAPTAPISVCVALADKIDSLVQLWQAGEKPTGSRDPLGLRRAALGIIKILLVNSQHKIALKSLIIEASKTGEEGTGDIYEFFIERLKYLLKAENIRPDIVDSVLDSKTDIFSVIYSKAKTLQEFVTTETGKNLLACYTRAANILSIEEKKDKTTYPAEPEKELLQVVEETKLFDAILASEAEISKALSAEDFGSAMNALAKFQPTVNAFFDKVMVNADDAKIRINRLKLLAKIRNFMDLIADFSKISG